MASNANLNYAESYQQALVTQFYQQGLYFNDLYQSPSNSLVTFENSKHVHVPDLLVNEGRRNRERGVMNANQATTNYSNDYTDYTLKFDRYWQTLIDPLDVDETNMVTTIANVTRLFNVQQKLPEMDRYMASQLFKEKQKYDASGIHEADLDEKNVLQAFDSMMENMDEARVNGTRILYITPRTYRMLKNAELKNRAGILNGNNNINRSVASLDDVEVKTIPSDLMHTDYNFDVGAQPIESSQQIEMFLITNGIQIAPQKYSYVGVSEESPLTSGNALYYEQSYGDVFILKPRANGIEFYISPSKSGDTSGKKATGGK